MAYDHVATLRALGVLGREPPVFADKTCFSGNIPGLDAQPLLDAIGTVRTNSVRTGQEVLPDGGAVAVGGRTYPLPLCPADAVSLYEALSPSPVGVEGRGDLLDETRRRSREGLVAHAAAPAPPPGGGGPPSVGLPPALAASDIAATMPELAEQVRRTLCPDAAAVEVVPYKLVGYAEGDFFGPHVDTTSDAAHCGTVSLHLPLTVDLDRCVEKERFPEDCHRGELVLYGGRWPAAWDGAAMMPPGGAIDASTISNQHSGNDNEYDKPSLGDSDTCDVAIDLSDYGRRGCSRPPAEALPQGAVPMNWVAWLTDVIHEVSRLRAPPHIAISPSSDARAHPARMTAAECAGFGAATPVPLDKWPMFRFVVTMKVYRRGVVPGYVPPGQSRILEAAEAYLAAATDPEFQEYVQEAMMSFAVRTDRELRKDWLVEWAADAGVEDYETSEGNDVAHVRRAVARSAPAHLGFMLHHRYPPAGLRPWTLRGVDRDLYLALSLEHRCAVAPAVFDRFDYMSAPYRLKQQWARSVVVSNAPADLPDVYADWNAAEKLVTQHDTVVSTAWVQLGCGALLGGGQSYGNGDCEAAWWYSGAVLVASGRHDGWRHTVRWALLLRERSANPKWREALRHVVVLTVLCQFL